MYRLIGGVFVVSLSACTLTPDYQRPETPQVQTESWALVPGYDQIAGGQTAHELGWQGFFEDPNLRAVISTALENNRNLRQAALSLEEARSLYRISRADLSPNVSLNASGSLAESSDDTGVNGRSVRTETYQANIGVASYELDLFGRVRSQNQAALNSYLATEQARLVVENALIAETANAYLQLLADQKLLALTQQTLDAQRETHELLSKSFEVGVASEQDVARAMTAVEAAQVKLHQFKRFEALDRSALYVLLGVSEEQFPLPETTLDGINVKENLNPVLPSEVLLLRPDVRQAEYELQAKNANIGAARAAFFPRISLTGSYGFASKDLDNLFSSSAAGAWSFMPSISLPIFQGGRNKANLSIAEIRKEQAIAQYEQAIQVAFREVSDTLNARATLSEEVAAQQRLVAAAQRVYDISDQRYKAGVDSFLSVLDAQRELYAHQQNAITTERQQLSNLVDLYKVLGGGVSQNL